MSKPRCRYGKLKSPSKGRRCRKRPVSRRRALRRAAKTGGGLLVLGLVGAGTVAYLVANARAMQAPPV